MIDGKRVEEVSRQTAIGGGYSGFHSRRCIGDLGECHTTGHYQRRRG